MKKVFNYLLVGALMMGMNVGLAKAYDSATLTEAGDTDAEVTVGDVEVPVYSVGISWENFVFDWAYNNNTNTYGWVNHKTCTAVDTLSELPGANESEQLNFVLNNRFYSDSSCATEINDKNEVEFHLEQKVDEIYYLKDGAPSAIYIDDSSTGGRVTPSLTWTPENTYNFTTASFKYVKDEATCVAVSQENIGDYGDALFTDSNCSGERVLVSNAPQGTNFYEWHIEEVKTPFQGEELPLEASSDAGAMGVRSYYLIMELGVDTTKEITTPTAGDRIGTLTISIETN